MKRIGIFMHRFDSGGAEKMTVILANELAKLGHQVIFYVRYDRGETRYLLDPEIKVFDMGLSESSRISRNLKNIRCLRGILKNPELDILLCITAEMSQVAAMATWMNPGRIPLVEVLHNTLSQETHSFQGMREKLFPVVDRRMDGVIAVSEAVRQDYIRLCGADPKRVFTVYNPVVSDSLFHMAQEPVRHPWLAKDRKWNTLVLAGRLSEQKNHKLMFQAMKRLCGEADYRLILLGMGELEEELKSCCMALGLMEKVDFYGYVKNPYPFYAQADAVVLSSRYEGLPTVLIEALACGARVISTDCPSGPREILENGRYGTLVPPENAEALAEGIREALKRKPDKKELEKRGRIFSVSESVRRYLEVLEQTEASCSRRKRGDR